MSSETHSLLGSRPYDDDSDPHEDPFARLPTRTNPTQRNVKPQYNTYQTDESQHEIDHTTTTNTASTTGGAKTPKKGKKKGTTSTNPHTDNDDTHKHSPQQHDHSHNHNHSHNYNNNNNNPNNTIRLTNSAGEFTIKSLSKYDMKNHMANERTFFKYLFTGLHIGSIGTLVLTFFPGGDDLKLYLVAFIWVIAFLFMFWGLYGYYRRKRLMEMGKFNEGNEISPHTPLLISMIFVFVIVLIILYGLLLHTSDEKSLSLSQLFMMDEKEERRARKQRRRERRERRAALANATDTNIPALADQADPTPVVVVEVGEEDNAPVVKTQKNGRKQRQRNKKTHAAGIGGSVVKQDEKDQEEEQQTVIDAEKLLANRNAQEALEKQQHLEKLAQKNEQEEMEEKEHQEDLADDESEEDTTYILEHEDDDKKATTNKKY